MSHASVISIYSSAYSPGSRVGKRRAALSLLLTVAWIGPALPGAAQAVNRVFISHASHVVISHTGVHTHANYLLFATGTYDLASMQRDPDHYPNLTLRAHSSLPTDHAALPPDLAAFGTGEQPLPNPYGPMDAGHGKPGWSLLPLHQNGKNWVKVLVPTRFANWLAVQSPARRRQYLMPRHYTLEITWGIIPPANR